MEEGDKKEVRILPQENCSTLNTEDVNHESTVYHRELYSMLCGNKEGMCMYMYSCFAAAWRAAVHGVTRSQTQLSDINTHTYMHIVGKERNVRRKKLST